MSNYLVVFEQAGKGCDYTIGCGTAVFSYEADSEEVAFKSAMEDMGWDEYYEHPEAFNRDPWDEMEMESVTVYEVEDWNASLFTEFRNEVRRRIAEANSAEQYEKDKKEFARLAKKLGKQYELDL